MRTSAIFRRVHYNPSPSRNPAARRSSRSARKGGEREAGLLEEAEGAPEGARARAQEHALAPCGEPRQPGRQRSAHRLAHQLSGREREIGVGERPQEKRLPVALEPPLEGGVLLADGG